MTETGALVQVVWVDSLQPTSGWQWVDKIPVRNTSVIRTAGFVLRCNDDHIALVMSLSKPDEDGDQQANGCMVIPRRSVLMISELEDKDSK